MAQFAALKPRKPPHQDRARVTREAIITAAAQIISRDGLGGYNTNAVAARAGVSIGSLYQYFPNKDALMVALIERQQANQAETLGAAFNHNSLLALPQLVRHLVRAAMAHHRDDPLLATAIDHEEVRLPIKSRLDDYLAHSAEPLAMLLDHHREIIGALDLKIAVITIPSMVRAIVDLWANQYPPQLQTAEDEAVRAVLGYLGRPDETARPLC
jgi:AcrR family transcriptional regulator